MPLHFSGYLGGSDIDDCDDVVSRNGGIYYACHSNSEDFGGSTPTGAKSDELDDTLYAWTRILARSFMSEESEVRPTTIPFGSVLE